MTQDQLIWQQNLQEMFPQDYDASFVPVLHAHWAHHEEHGWIYILEKDHQFYVQEGGYSVVEQNPHNCWALYAVEDDRLWEILVDWEVHME